MKCFLVLPVLALAALGAPVPQPASPVCLGLVQAGSPLPLSDYVWLDSLYGPPDTVYGDTLVSFGAAVKASQPAFATVEIAYWRDGVEFWFDSRSFMLGVGESATLVHSFQVGQDSAYFVVRDSIVDSLPTDSSVVTWRFWVLPRRAGVVFLDTTAPFDTIDTFSDFYVTIGLRNNGSSCDSGRLCFMMSDTARVVYAESMDVELDPGINHFCVFYVPKFTTTGSHHGILHFWTHGGSADTLEWDFWVGPPPSIQEYATNTTTEHKLPATVFRSLPPGAAVFDAMGRRVLQPKPGIYFVKEPQAQAEITTVRKVLLVK